MSHSLKSKHRIRPGKSERFTKLDLDRLPRLSRPLPLECARCNKKSRYRLGTIMISPRAVEDRDQKRMPEEYIGFTGYVRCKHCDSGGPWRFPPETMMRITVMMILKLHGDNETALEFGELATFDQQTFRYTTQSAEHIQKLIECEPKRAFLWTRLGNLYHHAERPDLAEPAFHRALDLNPEDFEAHGMYAQMLEYAGRPREAIPHWQAVLAFARSAQETPLQLRRNLVRAAFETILFASEEAKKQIPFFPTGHSPTSQHAPDEPQILEIREFDLSNERDVDAIVDSFLGVNRKKPWGRITDRFKFSRGDSLDGLVRVHSERLSLRNDPCSCGNGRKYKKCCGRAGA